jgi:hypothetical protein
LPDSTSIAVLFNWRTKEIGIVHFPRNEKLPFTEKYGSQTFKTMFKSISLTEQEQKLYPWILTKDIFYQSIKEADFDSFMILPRGFYAIDKNNVYTLSDVGNVDTMWR